MSNGNDSRKPRSKNKEVSDKLAERFRLALDTLSRKERRDSGLLQRELAKALDLTQSGLNHLVQGRSEFDVYQSHYLAKKLKVEIADLLPEEARLQTSVVEPPAAIDPTPIEKEQLAETYKFIEQYLAHRKQQKPPETIAYYAVKVLQKLHFEGHSLADSDSDRKKLVEDALNTLLLELMR
jgi:transcriptional regulator with XRE-family HTH domain